MAGVIKRSLARRARKPPTGDTDCAQCVSRRQCWPDQDGGVSLRVRRRAALATGTVLWRQGDAFVEPLVVRSGCIKTVRTDADGGSHILRFALPGDMLGLESLHSPRHASTAVVIDPAWVCGVRWHAVSTGERSRLQSPLLAHAARQLHANSSRPVHGDPRQLLLDFLREVAARIGERDATGEAIAMRLPMSRAEIGQHLGLAEETVCRVLKRLAAEQRLTVRARRVVLHEQRGAR